jgi:hypothetical protein
MGTLAENELARALGGDVNGAWINLPGPGHRKWDRSLGIRLDPTAPDGFRLHSFAGDDKAVCRKFILAKLQQIAGDKKIEMGSSVVDEARTRARIAAALAIWDEAQPAAGTIVETYLVSRKCYLSAIQPGVIRFQPYCYFDGLPVPAMLALMRDIRTGEPVGVHRTALAQDGTGKRHFATGQSARRMLGRAKDAAIQLQPGAPRMGVAEGIENALSASTIFHLPTWALMSAGGIATFAALSTIVHLTVFADHDEAGLRAARRCARRYAEAGVEGDIRHPPEPKSDWNDHILKE